MTKAVVKKFEKTCSHLLKKAESTWRVTYEHITEQAGTDASARALRDKVSEEAGVAWHPGRKASDRTVQEEEKRNSQAESWQRYPEDYWTAAIHGVIDNKTFPVPINADKKALLQKQKVHGHLRKKSEGLLPECVPPQGQRRGAEPLSSAPSAEPPQPPRAAGATRRGAEGELRLVIKCHP